MKTPLLLVISLLAPAVLGGQSIQADLDRAKELYLRSRTEEAKPLFEGILQSKLQVTTEQRVEALKFLGAYYALQGQQTEAESHFIGALDHDPFTTIDPKIFSPDEVDSFNKARVKLFKVGIDRITPAKIGPLTDSTANRNYEFRIVTTHDGSLNVEIYNTRDTLQKEIFPSIGQNSGVRIIQWNGLINAELAEEGLYYLRVIGRSRLMQNETRTEVQRFRVERRVAPLEEELPELGQADLIRDSVPLGVKIRDASKGAFVAAFAATLPFVALSQRSNMTGWRSHFGVGVGLGVAAGSAAAAWRFRNAVDPSAVAENARRRQQRLEFNAGVRERNQQRVARTILVILPLGG